MALYFRAAAKFGQKTGPTFGTPRAGIAFHKKNSSFDGSCLGGNSWSFSTSDWPLLTPISAGLCVEICRGLAGGVQSPFVLVFSGLRADCFFFVGWAGRWSSNGNGSNSAIGSESAEAGGCILYIGPLFSWMNDPAAVCKVLTLAPFLGFSYYRLSVSGIKC